MMHVALLSFWQKSHLLPAASRAICPGGDTPSSSDMIWHGWLTRLFTPSSLLRSTSGWDNPFSMSFFVCPFMEGDHHSMSKRCPCINHHSAPLAHSFLDAIILLRSQAALCWTAAGPSVPRSTSERAAPCHYKHRGTLLLQEPFLASFCAVLWPTDTNFLTLPYPHILTGSLAIYCPFLWTKK